MRVTFSQSDVQLNSKERVVSIPALGPHLAPASCPTQKIPSIRRPHPDGTRQPNGTTQGSCTTMQHFKKQQQRKLSDHPYNRGPPKNEKK